MAAIGQAVLTVTPLQAALATAALAGDGRLPSPRLVEAISGTDGEWIIQPPGTRQSSRPVLLAETAAAARAVWPEFAGAREFSVSVLSGPDGSRNSWFLGMAPATSPRYVVALVVEDAAGLDVAEAIGRGVLSLAAAP